MRHHLFLNSLALLLILQGALAFDAQGDAQAIIEPIEWEQVPLHIESIEPLTQEELYAIYAQEQGIDAQTNPISLESTYQASLTSEEVDHIRSIDQSIAPVMQLYQEEYAAQEQQQQIAAIDRETRLLEEEFAAQEEAAQRYPQSPVIVQEVDIPSDVQAALDREFELISLETGDALERDMQIMQIARENDVSFEDARTLYNVYEYVAVEDTPTSRESEYFTAQAGLSDRESRELVRSLQNEISYIERIETISRETGVDFATARDLNDQFEFIASEDYRYEDPDVQELQVVLGVNEQQARTLLASTRQSELSNQDPVVQLAQAAQIDQTTAQRLYNEFDYLRAEDVDFTDERVGYLQAQLGTTRSEAQALVNTLDQAAQPTQQEVLAREAGISTAQAQDLMNTFAYLETEDVQSTDVQAGTLDARVTRALSTIQLSEMSSAALSTGGQCPVI